ncbi:MAG: 2-isopropylmalate synthase [Desulfovibrionales bacterium]|nr:2-isopropylmalate synthase [Desulfovibrionales bacterium]
MNRVTIYDTTLRDGTQSEELNLTCEDKLRITRKLDDLGVHYIEGGWPGSNPTDQLYFKEIANYQLKQAKVAAFGSTHLPSASPDTDRNLAALLASKAPAATIFGKTWDFHVKEALKVSLGRNLELIAGSIDKLKSGFEEVFFDAEHFFDGFKANRDYALSCLAAAHDAGAHTLVLCDTNGGSLPGELAEIMDAVKEKLPKARLGIHCHNDCELAVANSIRAVECGAEQVQGAINGYGERAGNANLCSIIPVLELKMGRPVLGAEQLALLTPTAQYVSEIANLRPFLRQPFVGRAAFSHKGGVHVSAVMRRPATYEHIDPTLVGNVRRVLLSDLSGRSNILFKAKQYGYENLDKENPVVEDLLALIKEREKMGYEYSVAEASYELLFFKVMGWSKRYFTFLNFFVLDSKRLGDESPHSEATVQVRVNGKEEHTAATGNGPVNALDRALRQALEGAYPCIKNVRLKDFKVRVLSGAQRDTGGTSSVVRVLIESSDGKDRWTTVGVSHNIIEASWQALVDSMNYKLFKDDPQKWPTSKRRDEEDEHD